jgi:hypothetical protein
MDLEADEFGGACARIEGTFITPNAIWKTTDMPAVAGATSLAKVNLGKMRLSIIVSILLFDPVERLS